MGIQINGNTDTITAIDGALTVSGAELAGTSNINVAGIITASGFVGNVTGNINSTGVSTFTNGPVLIGATSSTGTLSQILQVTGNTYVSGNLGIGTTNPMQRLQIGAASTQSVFVDSSGNLFVGDPSLSGTFQGKINVIGAQSNTWSSSDTSNYLYQPYPNELQVINTQLNTTNSFASILLRAGQTSTDSQINSARIAAIRTAPFTTDLAFAVRSDGNTMSERLRMTSGGNIGIGLTNPTYQLHTTSSSYLPQLYHAAYYSVRAASISSDGLQTFSFTFSTGGNTMYLVTAASAHYGNSGYYCARQSYIGAGPGSFEVNLHNYSSSTHGSWSFSWSSNVLTVTHNAGNYNGGAQFWAVVQGG
jgi:hypothetical protein